MEFGAGAIERLPDVLGSIGARLVVLLTDPGLRSLGLLDRVLDLLAARALSTEVFDAVRANPSTEDLDVAAGRVREFAAATSRPGDAEGHHAVVVALGGGSVLDVAKGVALLATNPGRAVDYDYRRDPARPGLPVVAVPTTAGTGAETNGFGVVEDPVACCKIYVGHDSVRPRAAILDPELTLGLPPAATAATGVDALVHGIESLASRGSTAVSAGFARHAVALASRWLPVAVAHGEDIEARSQMLRAAHLAGCALTLSGLGLVHGIGHSLTNRFGTVHGVALAAVLPEVMTFCAHGSERARQAYAVAAQAMGAHDAISAAAELSAAVGTRRPLPELGLTASTMADVARGAVEDVVSHNSPRGASQADIEVLLRAAM